MRRILELRLVLRCGFKTAESAFLFCCICRRSNCPADEIEQQTTTGYKQQAEHNDTYQGYVNIEVSGKTAADSTDFLIIGVEIEFVCHNYSNLVCLSYREFREFHENLQIIVIRENVVKVIIKH